MRILIVVSLWIAHPVLGEGEYGGVLDTNWYWLTIVQVIISEPFTESYLCCVRGFSLEWQCHVSVCVSGSVVNYLDLYSRAALSLMLYQHARVWVHYYCTEEPDMRLIIGIEG